MLLQLHSGSRSDQFRDSKIHSGPWTAPFPGSLGKTWNLGPRFHDITPQINYMLTSYWEYFRVTMKVEILPSADNNPTVKLITVGIQ